MMGTTIAPFWQYCHWGKVQIIVFMQQQEQDVLLKSSDAA
jgi:hypothetical protein